MRRNRLTYLLLALAVIGLGLASRRYASALPSLIASYAGDTLWALMVFLIVGMLFPRWPTQRVCMAALLFAFAIEFSQLYHAAWIDEIREVKLGGLILGYGFMWSDLLCYGVGVATGCLIEELMTRRHSVKG